MRGRPPKPKAINDLKGDPSKKRKNKVEPKPPEGAPPCPDYLDDIAKEEWLYTVNRLSEMGLLSTADKTSLEQYAIAYSRYRNAINHVMNDDEIMETPNGHIQQSAWSGIANRQQDICRKYLIEFGLTPAARSRLAVDQATHKSSKLLDYIKAI